MRNASAKRRVMDAPFKNNLPRPFNDVMVNSGNPDSNPMAAAHIISNDDLVSRCLMYIRLLHKVIVETRCLASSPRQVLYLKLTPFQSILNQDFQDFQDYRERLRFEVKVICRRLLFTLLFADALCIGGRKGNGCTI